MSLMQLILQTFRYYKYDIDLIPPDSRSYKRLRRSFGDSDSKMTGIKKLNVPKIRHRAAGQKRAYRGGTNRMWWRA